MLESQRVAGAGPHAATASQHVLPCTGVGRAPALRSALARKLKGLTEPGDTVIRTGLGCA